MRLHPITSIYSLTTLFFMILLYNNPLYILSFLIFLIILIVIVKEKGSKNFSIIKFSLYNFLFLLVINPLLYQSGKTVLLKSPRLPIFGKIKITGEAIVYGANMGLKLACILLIFVVYEIVTNRDDTFSFFSRFAHKLTLTFSMTNNIIHRLRIETLRVKDVMEMRGINFHEKKLRKRILAYYPLLKVIFISALEGSVDRAEALYSRGYGKTKRSCYRIIEKSILDYMMISITTGLLIYLFIGLFYHIGQYNFYPRLQEITKMDMVWLVILDFMLAINLFLVWGCKQWKSLKYKI